MRVICEVSSNFPGAALSYDQRVGRECMQRTPSLRWIAASHYVQVILSYIRCRPATYNSAENGVYEGELCKATPLTYDISLFQSPGAESPVVSSVYIHTILMSDRRGDGRQWQWSSNTYTYMSIWTTGGLLKTEHNRHDRQMSRPRRCACPDRYTARSRSERRSCV